MRPNAAAISVLMLASALTVTAAGRLLAESVEDGIRREVQAAMSGRTEIERRSLVLCARGKVSINFQETVAHNLNKGGADATWALKVSSLSQVLLSRIAAVAIWPEMERYFETEAANSASLVRGEISWPEYVKRSKENEAPLALALAPERAREAVHASNFARLGSVCTQLSKTVIAGSKLASTSR